MLCSSGGTDDGDPKGKLMYPASERARASQRERRGGEIRYTKMRGGGRV